MKRTLLIPQHYRQRRMWSLACVFDYCDHVFLRLDLHDFGEEADLDAAALWVDQKMRERADTQRLTYRDHEGDLIVVEMPGEEDVKEFLSDCVRGRTHELRLTFPREPRTLFPTRYQLNCVHREPVLRKASPVPLPKEDALIQFDPLPMEQAVDDHFMRFLAQLERKQQIIKETSERTLAAQLALTPPRESGSPIVTPWSPPAAVAAAAAHSSECHCKCGANKAVFDFLEQPDSLLFPVLDNAREALHNEGRKTPKSPEISRPAVTAPLREFIEQMEEEIMKNEVTQRMRRVEARAARALERSRQTLQLSSTTSTSVRGGCRPKQCRQTQTEAGKKDAQTSPKKEARRGGVEQSRKLIKAGRSSTRPKREQKRVGEREGVDEISRGLEMCERMVAEDALRAVLVPKTANEIILRSVMADKRARLHGLQHIGHEKVVVKARQPAVSAAPIPLPAGPVAACSDVAIRAPSTVQRVKAAGAIVKPRRNSGSPGKVVAAPPAPRKPSVKLGNKPRIAIAKESDVQRVGVTATEHIYTRQVKLVNLSKRKMDGVKLELVRLSSPTCSAMFSSSSPLSLAPAGKCKLRVGIVCPAGAPSHASYVLTLDGKRVSPEIHVFTPASVKGKKVPSLESMSMAAISSAPKKSRLSLALPRRLAVEGPRRLALTAPLSKEQEQEKEQEQPSLMQLVDQVMEEAIENVKLAKAAKEQEEKEQEKLALEKEQQEKVEDTQSSSSETDCEEEIQQLLDDMERISEWREDEEMGDDKKPSTSTFTSSSSEPRKLVDYESSSSNDEESDDSDFEVIEGEAEEETQ